MLFTCAQCHRDWRIPDSEAAETVNCPYCSTAVRAHPSERVAPQESVDEAIPVDAVVVVHSNAGTAELGSTRTNTARHQDPVDDAYRSSGHHDPEADDRRSRRRRHRPTTSGLGLTLAICVTLMLVLASGAIGLYFLWNQPIDESEWREHADAEGRYKVDFPDEPIRSSDRQPLGPRGGRVAHSAECTRSGLRFTVHYLDRYFVRPDQLVEDGLYDAQDSFMAAFGGQIAESKLITSPNDTHPGIEFTVANGNVARQAAARFYLARSRLYLVVVAGRSVSFEDADVERFFRSFSLSDDVPSAPPPMPPSRPEGFPPRPRPPLNRPLEARPAFEPSSGAAHQYQGRNVAT